MRRTHRADPALSSCAWRASAWARAIGALVAVAVVLPQSDALGAGAAPAEPAMRRGGLSHHTADESPPPAALCALIERQAKRHKLPSDFFTRLLWKESLFDPHAVSPKGAQGIAQFMPGTAAERGLADPFDPEEAISHSARFLRELHMKFGNLGLAAAAYNAGPQRVTDWLSSRSSLPNETVHYVMFITGRAPSDWQNALVEELPADKSELQLECSEFVALASRGLIGGPRAARTLPNTPAVARHRGHKKIAAATPGRDRTASGPDTAAGEPLVTRLHGKARSGYAVQAGVPSHAEARKACTRLRAEGSYCIVVIR